MRGGSSKVRPEVVKGIPRRGESVVFLVEGKNQEVFKKNVRRGA